MQVVAVTLEGRAAGEQACDHHPQAVRHRDTEPQHHAHELELRTRRIVDVDHQQPDADAERVTARVA